MNLTIMPISDEDFLNQFEDQSLAPDHFNHLGHLRIAWLYLNDLEVDEVIERVSEGIKAYAGSLGAPQKFHLTITDAIVRIMAKRIDKLDEKSWTLFLQENADLVNDSVSVIKLHYSEALISSEEARITVLQPDIRPI